MSAANAVRDFVEPILPGWSIQFGRWTDSSRADRVCVIKPAGGLGAELIRQPRFSLVLIGADGDTIAATYEKADAIIEAMRASAGDLVYMEPAEPVYMPADDGRAIFEIAVSAITN
jgi:hypothetical protein